jgi:DNA-binding PadR family transcriptional regulator
MNDKEVDVIWVSARSNIKAVMISLRKPMTNGGLTASVNDMAPRMKRWDVSKVLKKCMARGFVYKVIGERDGSIYWLTDYGAEIVERVTGKKVEKCPDDIRWDLYRYIVSYRQRGELLMIINDISIPEGPTASIIRKIYKSRYSSKSLNHIIRSLDKLKKKGAIKCIGRTKKGHHQIYGLTPEGKKIVGEILR